MCMLQFFGKDKQNIPNGVDKSGKDEDQGADSSSSDESDMKSDKENGGPPGSPAFGDSDNEDFEDAPKDKGKGKGRAATAAAAEKKRKPAAKGRNRGGWKGRQHCQEAQEVTFCIVLASK
jgi:hypothetical protein